MDGQTKFRLVLRNGMTIYESEEYRQEKARREDERAERTQLRAKLGIKLEDVEGNAERLFRMMDEQQCFGDPAYNPAIIFRPAASQLGLEPEHVMTLIDHLLKQGRISFHYNPDHAGDPREVLDTWNVLKR